MTVLSELPLAGVVALVNGWGSVPRAVAGEQELAWPDVGQLRDALGPGPWSTGRLRDTSLVEVADQLHPIFAAGTPAQRGRRTAALLDATGVRPTVRTRSDGLRADWSVDRPRDALLAAAALALRQHLADHDGERLGLCSGVRCADVYVDASPVGHRRYCSVTCQNRARVAAFRRRALAAG